MKTKVEQDNKTNYSFILKWMSALAAAALLLLGLITAWAVTAGAGASIAAIGLALTVGASFVSAAPIIAIAGAALLAITGLCLIPFLFCKNTSYVVNPIPVYSRPYSPGWGGWGSTIFTPANGGFGNSGTTHGHGGSVFSGSNVHAHHGGGMGGQSGTIHGHR